MLVQLEFQCFHLVMVGLALVYPLVFPWAFLPLVVVEIQLEEQFETQDWMAVDQLVVEEVVVVLALFLALGEQV